MKYRVSITERDNGYGYTGEWDSDTFQDDIVADSPSEALYIAKGYLTENGVDASDYIFKIKEVK